MSAVRQAGPGDLGLAGGELEWVNAKWREIRKAQTDADAANNKWNRINDEIESYLDRSGIHGFLMRAEIKGQSLPLKDALGVGSWKAANAQRHIDDLGLFLEMKRLRLL